MCDLINCGGNKLNSDMAEVAEVNPSETTNDISMESAGYLKSESDTKVPVKSDYTKVGGKSADDDCKEKDPPPKPQRRFKINRRSSYVLENPVKSLTVRLDDKNPERTISLPEINTAKTVRSDKPDDKPRRIIRISGPNEISPVDGCAGADNNKPTPAVTAGSSTIISLKGANSRFSRPSNIIRSPNTKIIKLKPTASNVSSAASKCATSASSPLAVTNASTANRNTPSDNVSPVTTSANAPLRSLITSSSSANTNAPNNANAGVEETSNSGAPLSKKSKIVKVSWP